MAKSAAACGVCDLFNKEQTSTIWCYECDEGLCLDCERHHGLSDEKSHHRLIPILDSGQLLPFSKVKEVCQEHEKSNCFYCRLHDIALCKICLKSHECYRAISGLKDNITLLRKPDSFEYVESVLTEVTKNIKNLKDNIQINLSDTFEQREKLKEEIDNARIRIHLFLDQLQEIIFNDLSKAEEKIKRQTDKSIWKLTQMEKQVKECEISIDNVKKYTPDLTDLKLFLSKEQVYSDATDIEKCMQSLIDDRQFNNFHLSLKKDQVIHNLLNYSFGKININYEATPIENEIYTNIEQRMVRKISPPQPSNPDNLTLLYKADTNRNDIIGCALLADGKIALCRSLHPFSVTLWNQDGSHEAELGYAAMLRHFCVQYVMGR